MTYLYILLADLLADQLSQLPADLQTADAFAVWLYYVENKRIKQLIGFVSELVIIQSARRIQHRPTTKMYICAGLDNSGRRFSGMW